MKFKIFNIEEKYPFLVVDDWFTDDEENSIWSELNFYLNQPNVVRAENTLSAKNPDGTTKSKSFRYYVDSYYAMPNVSHILRLREKFKNENLLKEISKIKPYSRNYLTSNWMSSLISYYEEKDHYDSHSDITSWTCLIWMVKEPISFSGGDFYFTEINQGVKLKNNRALFFPSCYLHGVTPLSFKNKNDLGKGLGRYTITTFFDIDVNKGYQP
nr:2OG-Fe(II) oxygenase [uncultured Mediterranean phage uvMED]